VTAREHVARALCWVLKSDLATRAVPVLLATAQALSGTERLCATNGYMARPFARPALLVEKIREMLAP